MKRLLLSALLLLVFALCAAAQTTTTPSVNVFRLGDREVSIPPPAGFVEAASRSEAVRKFFETAEAPMLDFLAAYLPAQLMEQLERGETREMDFYTRVAVSKRLREVNYSPQDFSKLVATLRSDGMKALDFNSPEIRALLKQQNEKLSELLQQHMQTDLSQPTSLGEIENTANTYGKLLLVKVTYERDDIRKEKMLLSGACAVRVGERLVWVYTYKAFNSEKDADELRAFTKRWLAEIVRANPSAPSAPAGRRETNTP